MRLLLGLILTVYVQNVFSINLNTKSNGSQNDSQKLVIQQTLYPFGYVKIRVRKNLDEKPSLNIQQKHLFKIITKNQWPKTDSAKNDFTKIELKYDLIEYVPFTDYLAGVVSKEMPLNWPIEALKAQAVIARSYALTKILERQNKDFHMDADQMDQVFSWTTSKKAYDVVKSTEGVVLTHSESQQIVKTFYHADCGGHTIPAPKIWPGAIDTGTAKDEWCGQRQKNQWSHRLNIEDFKKTLSEKKMTLEEDQRSDVFKGKFVSFKNISLQKMREWFGFGLIRNSPSLIEIDKDHFVLTGQGYGHGVGLCQWGSLHLAKNGLNYMDILKHYYPKTEISRFQELSIKNLFTKHKSQGTVEKLTNN